MPKAARQLALPLETHRNHYLFSDHFLNQVLPGQDVWLESEAEARQALDAIVELYSRLEDALPHYNEAALEQEWIRPVLDILGHVYHVQPSLTGAAGTPDYAFFTGEPAKQAAAHVWGTPAFWETALTVGDAKRWDRPLDKRIVNGAPDAFTNANPCYQIDYYLRRTGCAWGVVSNGRQWRLYHRDTSFRLDVFYEVDLVQLIEQGKLAAFRYFYLFFRAIAFRPDADGRCWLDEVLAQSTAYAVHVGDELKGRVYEALRLLAQGFLDYPTNRVFSEKPGLCPDPTTDLSPVHDACLILLYRLLFLLYAESRGLLPLDNPSYGGQYSLKAIKEDIAHKTDEGVVYLAKKATLWDDLRTLFNIIYSGQEALGVPAYDGRLFDPARYPFLEERTIGDRYLAQAIDLLARAEAGPGQGLSFVDYRDLSIRHLGSIYEGLLEYRLAYATEEMAVVRRGKREEIVPASEVEKPAFSEKTRFPVERFPAGQVYLVTDRGERKATGSYYTPGYIVKYIVEQTLGPLADAQAEAVEREIAALKAKNKGGARRTKAYKEALARLQNSFADHILDLNALDPAMGSGHFLVEATDYLARRIVEAGVVTETLADGDEESELSYWRRRVVERCIYGVDLNPLAVELAKLSLWLTTVARGKPLSFLDHHLRCGNSLIGARVADLQALPVRKKKRREKEAEPQQLAMWDESAFTKDMYRVVGAMRQIGEYETADLVSVKEKERLFEETVERERRKWRTIADLWTATYFGLELTPQLYNACVQYVQGQPVLLQAAQAEALLDQAHEIWGDKRFFHWEIEFPEVFFDEYGRHKGETAGFDAVVGNPPWGAGLDFAMKGYLAQFYCEVHQRTPDTAKYFIGLTLRQVAEDGIVGLIVPNNLLFEHEFARTRELLLTRTQLVGVVNLGDDVFLDAITPSCTVVFRNCVPSEAITILDLRHISKEPIHPDLNTFEGDQIDPSELLRVPGYTFQSTASAIHLLSKCFSSSLALGDVSREVAAGISTGGNSVFLLGRDRATELSLENETLHPILIGADILSYYVPEDTGQVIIYTNKDFDSSRHPHIMEYLAPYKERLSQKRETRKGLIPWYSLHWPRYPALFDSPKVVFRQTSDTLIVAIDPYGYYILNSLLVVHLAHGCQFLQEYMLALLNSKLLRYIYGQIVQEESRVFAEVKPVNLRKLPIRRIAFTTPLEERERLVEEALDHEQHEMARKARNVKGDFVSFADFRVFRDSDLGRWLEARLSAEPEQADVVHDLLAHLAGRMIEMHKEKQAEVRGFLDWVAQYTGRPVDEWALKTHLRRYYEQDWAEMQRILKRNQRKLPRVDLDVEAYKNEPAARIRAAWETSMETLHPLLAHIEATDRLIDRIVYRLYGLTEEEVAVVQGTP